MSAVASLADDVRAAQAVYTERVLGLYDFVVLGISNHLVWKCPTRTLLELYNRCVTANHLEVGVGTGYFLDHCRFPVPRPRVALMDVNAACLERAARRLRRYRPELYRRSILEPISYSGPRFESVGLNYVLHCLPGTLAEKAAACDHLARLMNPGAVLFGATLLSHGVPRSAAARWLMRQYCRRRIFSNAEDSLDELVRALQQRFRAVEVRAIGCGGAFTARAG